VVGEIGGAPYIVYEDREILNSHKIILYQNFIEVHEKITKENLLFSCYILFAPKNFIDIVHSGTIHLIHFFIR